MNIIISTLFIALLMFLLRAFRKSDFTFTSFFYKSEIYHKNEDQIQNAVRLALKKSKFIFIKDNNDNHTAYTLISVWSFSEIIKVHIVDNSNSIEVCFRSSCYYLFQFIDWGKNKRNAETFFKNLELELKLSIL